MVKKKYLFIGLCSLLIYIIAITVNTNISYGTATTLLTQQNIQLDEGDNREKIREHMKDISNAYYVEGDEDNYNYVTARMKVTRQTNKSGQIEYYIGEDKDQLLLRLSDAKQVGDEDANKDSWYVWMDIYFDESVPPKVYAFCQNIYKDTDDFEPTKDGWEGQRKTDTAIKKFVKKVEQTVGNAVSIAKSVVDFVAKFLKNVWGTIISTIMDFFGMIGDGIQWLANTIQTDEGNNVLYSYKYLSGDKKAAQKKNIYTNVGKCEAGAKVITGIDVKKDGNDDGEDDFSKKTKIPVMVGDLYNIAVGHLDFLDADFLTGRDSTRPDGSRKHEEGSAWIVLRDFASTLIHICIYVASAILIITLIWYGIKIVRTSLDNPKARAEYKEGLERFEKSLLMLIGSIVIMALCILGTKAFYSNIEEESYELPIRVNVEDTYSFSTTAAGYVRYMSLTDDVNEWLQKVVCTMVYLLLAIVNLVMVLLMMARVLILWILSMAGPIIAAMSVFKKGNTMKFGTWAEMYVSVSFIQVIIAFIYKLILAIIV